MKFWENYRKFWENNFGSFNIFWVFVEIFDEISGMYY